MRHRTFLFTDGKVIPEVEKKWQYKTEEGEFLKQCRWVDGQKSDTVGEGSIRMPLYDQEKRLSKHPLVMKGTGKSSFLIASISSLKQTVESKDGGKVLGRGGVVHVIKPSECLSMLSFYPPTENGRQGPYISWWLHFKRMVPKSLRKTFRGFKTGKKLRDLHLIGTEKDSIIESFLR